MFDYVVTEFSPVPDFVLEPSVAPPGWRSRHVFDSVSIVLDLPTDEAGLRSLRSGQFWQGLRRRQRRFEEEYGPWRLEVRTSPGDVAGRLPAVRELFAQRWAEHWTSLPWHTAEGFAPWAEALTGLAERGELALATLETDDGRLLSFSVLLLQTPWCFAWQHATTPDPAFRGHALGPHLFVATFRWLMEQRPDIAHYDFMLGDDRYKLDWESWRRPVHRRFTQPATLAGELRLTACAASHRLRRAIRHRPVLHAFLQRLRHTAGARAVPFASSRAATPASRP